VLFADVRSVVIVARASRPLWRERLAPAAGNRLAQTSCFSKAAAAKKRSTTERSEESHPRLEPLPNNPSPVPLPALSPAGAGRVRGFCIP